MPAVCDVSSHRQVWSQTRILAHAGTSELVPRLKCKPGHGAHVTRLSAQAGFPRPGTARFSLLPHPPASTSQPCLPSLWSPGTLLRDMVTVRARSLPAISIFHTNFPRGLGGERAGLSPLELGEGKIQGEKVTVINQPVHFCPPPAPTTSLIRTCCALSYTRVPDAALKPIL